jgi:hypothetical protein
LVVQWCSHCSLGCLGVSLDNYRFSFSVSSQSPQVLSSNQYLFKVLSANDATQLKQVFYSGEPWLVLCQQTKNGEFSHEF